MTDARMDGQMAHRQTNRRTPDETTQGGQPRAVNAPWARLATEQAQQAILTTAPACTGAWVAFH